MVSIIQVKCPKCHGSHGYKKANKIICKLCGESVKPFHISKEEQDERADLKEDKMRAMCEDGMNEEKEAYQLREEGEIIYA